MHYTRSSYRCLVWGGFTNLAFFQLSTFPDSYLPVKQCLSRKVILTGADPENSKGRGPVKNFDIYRGNRPILHHFWRNVPKFLKIWLQNGGRNPDPLDPPLDHLIHCAFWRKNGSTIFQNSKVPQYERSLFLEHFLFVFVAASQGFYSTQAASMISHSRLWFTSLTLIYIL